MTEMAPQDDHVPGWKPQWPAPANVLTWATERGLGGGVFGRFNLGLHVGDDPERVHTHRALLQRHCGGMPLQWLSQVHGTRVHCLSATPADRLVSAPAPQADALYTNKPGVALAIMTADCLPVLLADRNGREIAAVHAGWRGLAAGILQQVIAAFEADPVHLMAWLGPAICAEHFEVGDEVRQAFVRSPAFYGLTDCVLAAFVPSVRQGHYYCDLYHLARIGLRSAGLVQLHGGELCTYHQPQRFYSYRREGVCGRMAAVIALR